LAKVWKIKIIRNFKLPSKVVLKERRFIGLFTKEGIRWLRKERLNSQGWKLPKEGLFKLLNFLDLG